MKIKYIVYLLYKKISDTYVFKAIFDYLGIWHKTTVQINHTLRSSGFNNKQFHHVNWFNFLVNVFLGNNVVCIHTSFQIYWGEPEQAPHWLKSVMVSYITCTDWENDKIQLRSHSSLSWFRTSHVRTVRMIKYDWQRFISMSCVPVDCECWGVDEVRDETLRRWTECDRREKERN